MQVCVNYENKKWKKYKIDFEKIAQAAVSAIHKDSEVSITLVNDKQIHKINKQYRGIDKPTNVLSFELGDDVLLGDIFISLDTVIKEAKIAKISVEEHTAHMIVHGMLHLQGYDHLNDDEAKIMEDKEIKILKKLGYKNPYEDNDSFEEMHVCDCDNNFWKYICAAFFGIITSFGFAPFYLWPLSLIGIGGMYWLASKQNKHISFIKSWLQAFPFGAFYGIAMFWWVLNSIYVVPELAEQFAIWTIPGLIGIGLICGIILSIPFAVVRYVSCSPAKKIVLFAATWAFVLWGREWFLTGFPWNPISNITINFPMIINSMSLWGALGLSFIIIGLISGFIEIIRHKECKACKIIFGVFIILFVIGCVFGYRNMKISMSGNADNNPIIRIIQPAKSAAYKSPTSREEALKIAEQKIRDLFVWATMDKSGKPDLIVYPETSYPYFVYDTDKEIDLVRILNTNVVFGTNHYNIEKQKVYNSMVVADKSGDIKRIYSKSHLVPFGEYGPFGGLVPTPGNLSAGDGAETITIKTDRGDFIFAPAICYEIIFSDSVIPKNITPDAIINITNDNWFGTTPGIYQHLDMVRRYAIESGVPVVRANYSGISAFILSDGNIISSLPVKETGSLDGFVYGAHNTPYRAIGRDGWMVIILMFSIILSISISVFQKKD